MSGNFDDTSRELSLTAENFDDYLNSILHDWLKTLTTLGCALIPAFFILDYFTMPKDLIPRFGIYRLSSTVVFFVQWYIVRRTKASPRSFYHGYVASINAGLTIVLMTVDLGGFDSSYYAGLNLIIMGVNLLLPWKAIYSAINSGSIIAVYLVLNFFSDQAYSFNSLYNHLFFMFSTAIIAVCINHLRYNLVKKEFYLMVELKRARDALWSEMEIAKRIQTALLPERKDFSGFEIAATMLPAKEVGGDYYDIIETPTGERWIAIGDVSGHGVDSGLVMMMAQTSLLSTVNECSEAKPSQVLGSVNSVLRENISRLGSDYYMTMT
ncbi:MAG: SpoIIE family protein phosphatase, partial [Chlorobiales bacterium]|nr:SpoIIE family protein phosphatase [Chlorobiales bacterium]